MRRLTTDGGAASPRWTSHGQIVFNHFRAGEASYRVRLMNADGTGGLQIHDDVLANLTAAGCTICPYAPAQGGGSVSGHGDAYWQPAP
jgi:hypothetical protein